MSDLVTRINQTLDQEAPALARTLSPLGRRVVMPAGIPVQAREARAAAYNGTIGQLTDGHGGALTLPTMDRVLRSLGDEDRNRAFLYSPVAGITELRERWRRWQRRTLEAGAEASHPSSLPLVTCGLSHSLSILADLFGGEGRTVIAPAPYWGNYNHVFTTRTGARILSAPAFVDGRYHSAFAEAAVAADPELGEDEPVLVILNLPSNPGGYSATVDERAEIRASLVRLAQQRPVMVICDDAYAGLVYEADIPRESMFWDLVGQHPQLTPVKVDGSTKEFTFFGGRVGFLTFPYEPESPAAKALESKVMGMVRSTVGSPVASSQAILLQALREESIEEEIEAVRQLLERRYQVLREALDQTHGDLLLPQPFNSGSFALLQLAPTLGLDAERVRKHLLDEESTGLISIGRDYLRIAHCSVDVTELPELVRRLERGVSHLAGRGVGA
ncbi:MAG: aminotransferase class I/II-fold pyridoxal phosphate-dependent enzyme [Acidobacteriota bacterium]|nr:aminotransferase class I/II-fold pyridoxal phosphate-dependent enzyme [Acidobacteriota bacterium]